ncbi:prealbumin-like fold domain-containing protein [Lacticaseibacillus sp. GG6-2]
MAGKYLFSVQQTDAANNKWYSVVHNGNTDAGTDLSPIYKALMGASTDWGYNASISTSNYFPFFEPFVRLSASGVPTSANLPFEIGKQYTLKPYQPVAGAETTFTRSSSNLSAVYYMPDGLPSFTFTGMGDVTLDTSNANGRAVPGQWHTNAGATQIIADVYKVKRVKIVDQNNNPISGATVNFSDMKVTTGSDGTGEIVPKTWSSDATSGAAAGFYWGKGTGDGTQAFQNIAFAGSDAGKYYLPASDFALKLDTKTDKLSVTNNDVVGATDTNGTYGGRTEQTITLKVIDKSTLTDAQKNFSIKKTDTDTGNALAGAEFSVTDKSTTDPVKATTTAATGSDGLAGVTVPATSSTSSRIVAVQEATAPDGYAANKTTYYAKWKLGSGFTDVGTDANATPTDKKTADNQVSVDSDGHLVFADKKLTKAQTTLSIKKTAQDGTTALAGSKFYVTEPATDKASDPLAGTTTDATGTDGMVSVALPTGSTTATRVVKVQETQSHSGYQIDPHVYYAKWVQGSGFTAVTAGDVNGSDPSDSTNPTAKSAANAMIDNAGNLVIKNNPTSSFSGDTGYRWRYVNAAGQGINGAALPATPGVNIMSNGEAYDGLAGLILNPNSKASDFMQPASVDVSIVPGQAFDNGDSSMATAKEVSGDATNGAGYGVVQPLWTTKPLPISISSGDLYDQINNAVTKGYLLTSPLLGYSIQNTAMKQRAAASTDAYHYYVNDSNVKLYAPASGGDIAADSQSNGSTLTNAVTTSGKTASVVLNKVKLLKLKDTNGNPLSGDTATFKDSTGKDVLTATTGSDGTGELIPTNKDVFAWPSGSLTLDKITDASGNKVDIPATGGELKLDAKADTLSFATPVANSAEITADSDGNAGQVVQYTLKAQSSIKLNVVNENGFRGVGTDHLAGSAFKITRLNTGDVYTGTSDADGNINIDLPNPPTDIETFKIEQTKATPGYSKISSEMYFRWSKAKGATSVGGLPNDTSQISNSGIGDGGAYKVNSDGSMTVMLPQRIVIRQSAMFDLGKTVDDENSGPDYTFQEYNGTTPVGAAFTSGAYNAPGSGTACFAGPIINAQSPDKVRTFKLSVKNPLTDSKIQPYQPLSAGTSYFLKWSGAKGVISVSKTADGTFSQKTPDSVASVMNSPIPTGDDPEQSIINLGLDQYYTINAMSNAPTASGRNQPVAKAQFVYVGNNNQSIYASSSPFTDSTGKLRMTGQTIYTQILGGKAGTMPATAETDSFKMYADGAGTTSSQGSYPYNGVDTHEVNFTFGKGFSVPGENTATDPQQIFDKDAKISPSSSTALSGTSQLQAGELGVYFRRYVLRAQASNDQHDVNATFGYTMTNSTGATVTGTLTTNTNGLVKLPDPISAFGKTALTAMNVNSTSKFTMTIKQTWGSPDMTMVTDPITLTYQARTGWVQPDAGFALSGTTADYLSTAPTSGTVDRSTIPTMDWTNTTNDVTTQTVNTFLKNNVGVGTQVVYDFPWAEPDVGFVDIPDSNDMNFGMTEVNQPTAKSLPLQDNSDPENLAGGIPTTLLSDSFVQSANPGASLFGVRLKQTGSYPDGWHVDLTAGAFTVNGRTDPTVDNSTIDFAENHGGMYTKSTSGTQDSFNPAALPSKAHTIMLGSGVGETMMNQKDAVNTAGEVSNIPGTYTAYWQTSGVSLHLPAGAGINADALYQSNMTWTRVLDAPDGNN